MITIMQYYVEYIMIFNMRRKLYKKTYSYNRYIIYRNIIVHFSELLQFKIIRLTHKLVTILYPII